MSAPPVSPRPTPGPVVFGDPTLRTEGDLLALAFAADGSLWSVEEPGVVRQWDSPTGRQTELYFLSDLETLWGFSADGRLLASASDVLTLWDVGSGRLLDAIPQASWVTALAFAPDPTFLATGHDDGVVRYWDLRRREVVCEYRPHESPVSALAVGPSGARLASAGEDKVIHLRQVAGNRPAGTLIGHPDRIPALAWHPHGKQLVSAGWDTTARVWDVDSGEPVILLNAHAAQVTALAFSPGGDLLASADSDNAVHIWQGGDYKLLHVLTGAEHEIRCLAFSRCGQRLAAGGGDRVIHLWEPKTGQSLSAGGSGPARASIVLSPDGGRLVCTGAGLAVRAWDTASILPLREYALEGGGPVNVVAGSPDGRWLAAGGADAHVRIWDARSGVGPTVLEGEGDPVTALAFSMDSKRLASGSSASGEVWLWDVESAEAVLLIPDALDGCIVQALAFHPDGRRLAAGGIDWLCTGGSDGAACLWDIVDRCEVATLPGGATCLAIHPGGRWLATASLAHSVCIWDLNTQELALELTGPEDTITCLAFSPDGSRLACGGDDRTLHFWTFDADRPAAAAVAKMPLDTQVKALSFSADGRFLYTGNGNTTCYRVDVAKMAAAGEG